MKDHEFRKGDMIPPSRDPSWSVAMRGAALVLIMLAVCWMLLARGQALWDAEEGPRVPSAHAAGGPPAVIVAPAAVAPYLCSQGCDCHGDGMCDANADRLLADGPGSAAQCCGECLCERDCCCGEALPDATGSHQAESMGGLAP